MSLKEVKNKLYKNEADEHLGEHDESEFDPHSQLAHLEKEGETKEQSWRERLSYFSKEQNKAIGYGAIVFGVILVLVIGSVTFLNSRFYSFSDDRVKVSVSGPQEAPSGKLLSYEISVNNDNRASLENAVLRVSYPENFKPQESEAFTPEGPTSGVYNLGKLTSYSQKKLVFNGRMSTSSGALIYLKAELSYQPATLSGTFISGNQLGINITSSSVAIEVQAPQNISTGDEVNYLVTYKNTGEKEFSGLRIRMEYPSGFTFTQAEPRSLESDSIWYIGPLAPGEGGRIVVNGRISGNRDEIKTVKAFAGSMEGEKFVSYVDESAVTKIVSSPIAISQMVNEMSSLSVLSGQSLRFEISYKNEGTLGLRDVIVTEKIDSPVLDYTTLDMSGGSYDSSTKMITWKSDDYSNLKFLNPGDGGKIVFSIKVKEVIPVASVNDKNFVISSIAKADSPDVPTPVSMNKIIAGNKMDMKLNSKLVLDVNGFYNDGSITNSGPIPPKVDQETTYTIHWIAKNVSNDVTGAKVEAVLPTTAKLTGKNWPEDAKITYNERNNSLIWDIGSMKAGDGILTSPQEVSFQVKIKPGPNQIGEEVGLIGESTISATDSFTGEKVEFIAKERDTRLYEDTGISFGYKVVE